MIRFIFISICSGILFGFLDGVINANPIASRLFEFYKPIAKSKINIFAGIVIDIMYGFVLSGVYVILYNSLPGESGIVKGLSYSVIVWFFRVLMYSLSKWMIIKMPIKTVIYTNITGLIEMAILGSIYGFLLK